MLLKCGNNISNLIINEYHLIKKHQIYCLEKLNIRELYDMQLLLSVKKPTAQTYFEKKFQNPELEWKDIYTLPRRVTINPSICRANQWTGFYMTTASVIKVLREI